MNTENFIKELKDEYIEYLSDESRLVGNGQYICFPQNEQEVIKAVLYANARGIKVTVQGSRTGLSGGAVPVNGGLIINLSRFTGIKGIEYNPQTDEYLLNVSPGNTLFDLREKIMTKDFDISSFNDKDKHCFDYFRKDKKYFFPPDPTETLASIGGMVSCNASGACSYYYGATREYIEGIDIVLPTGRRLEINRGDKRFEGRNLKLFDEKSSSIVLPEYDIKLNKNVAGFYAKDNMDLLDLFIGSEGSLGIITGIKIRLIKRPQVIYGFVCFFKKQDLVVSFVDKMRNIDKCFEDAKVAAIEYIDSSGLGMIHRFKNSVSNLDVIPDFDEEYKAAIYIELHGNDRDMTDEDLQKALIFLEECEGIGEWIAADDKEIERLKVFRHAVPELANNLIDSYKNENNDLTVICTDLAVRDEDLVKILNMYNGDLCKENLDGVIYGHIGNSHLHVNILPKNVQEYNKGMELYAKWAKRVAEMGGTISAEHGIGKQKKDFLKFMITERDLNKISSIKEYFDEHGIISY